MRPHAAALITALLVSSGLAMPPSAEAGRSKPATKASAAPDSWSRQRAYPPFELYGQFKMPKTVKDEAQLTRTKWGYRFVAGARDNKLTVTPVGDKVRFHDRVLSGWTNVPDACDRVAVDRGRAVVCKVPDKLDDEMFLEIWPRLGSDTIDTSALPSKFRTWALTDAGKDVVRTGAGRDFVNTANDPDRASGGAGDDWIRLGRSGNTGWAGDGNDKIVGGSNGDHLHGGAGNDTLGGLSGNDVLRGNAGADLLAGKTGRDVGYREGSDTLRNVEVVRRS